MLPNGRIKGLDLYWEGKVNIPSPNTPIPYAAPSAVNDPSPNPLEYSLRESVAYLTIWNNIKNPSGLGIPSGKTSSELWQYLETEYLLVSQLARQRKEDALRDCCYVDGIDGRISGEGGYAEKMRLLRKAAVDAGAHIPDERFITIFLDSFPRSAEWNVITGPLMMEKSFNIIVARLQDYHLRRVGENSRVPEVQKTSVLEATLMDRITQLEQALSASNISTKKGKRTNLVCTNPNCPPKNRIGHMAEDCYAIGGGKQGQYPSWWKGKKNTPLPSATTTGTEDQSSSSSRCCWPVF
ncbi:hypothetical protein L218DRAFT_975932 [Marasmius fiardii PR-910]|nr:hypothetical protein L218DRAFT_975932 [Marasmius fiardii PR-910]